MKLKERLKKRNLLKNVKIKKFFFSIMTIIVTTIGFMNLDNSNNNNQTNFSPLEGTAK